MVLFRYIQQICLLVIMCIGGLLAERAQGAELPRLAPPVTYQGEYSRDYYSYRVLLYLGSMQNFILYEEIALPNGKVSSWETTGRWHQIQDETFLQLTNRSGFYRMLNVGSGANLYIGMHMHTGRQVTVQLQYAKDIDIFEHHMSGKLIIKDGTLFFEDANSGVVHSIVPENIVNDFLKENALEGNGSMFAHTRVGLEKDKGGLPSLRIKDIQSIPEGKTWELQNTPNYFLDAVAGDAWLITRIGDDELSGIVILSFLPERGKKDGTLEIFDGNRHIAGKYTLRDTRLTLTANVDNKSLGALLKKTESWQLAGEVLELWGAKQLLAVLEKARW